jgi:hypothetical protein
VPSHAAEAIEKEIVANVKRASMASDYIKICPTFYLPERPAGLATSDNPGLCKIR